MANKKQNVTLFQQNWSGGPGRDLVVLLLKVYWFFRLFLLHTEEKVFSPLDPSRGSSRGSAHCRLVRAKGNKKAMQDYFKKYKIYLKLLCKYLIVNFHVKITVFSFNWQIRDQSPVKEESSPQRRSPGVCFIETCFPNKNKKLYPDISAIQATFLICPVLVCGGRTHNILRIPQLFCPRGHVQLLLPRCAGALDPAIPLVEALHYQAADDAVHHLHHSRVAASVHRVQLSQGERFSSKLQPHLQDQVRTWIKHQRLCKLKLIYCKYFKDI